MKKIIKSMFVIVAVAAIAIGATGAYFTDSETSNNNVISSGSLDLNVDGGNSNVVKFNVSNIVPGDEVKGTYTLSNVGTINGQLDLSSIVKRNYENTCIDSEAGDLTCGAGSDQGELGSKLNIKLFVDPNNNGVIDGAEVAMYNGTIDAVPSSVDLNLPLNAGATNYISAIVNWPSSASDNMAMTDSVEMDITFTLDQV